MVLLLFVAAGIAAALIRGGRLSRLSQWDLSWLWLPIASFLLKGGAQLLDPPAPWDGVMCTAQYVLLLIFALRFRRRAWAVLFGLGTAANFLVIAMNGFRMPVSQAVLSSAGSQLIAQLTAGEIPGYTLQTAQTHLPFLGDILAVGPLGFASVGDLLLGLGAGLLAYRLLMAQCDNEKHPGVQ